jgi:PKD repeat protein
MAALISVSPPADQTAIAGQTVLVALGSFTQANGAGPYTVTVNWGDGSSGHFSVADAGAIPSEAHIYASAGSDTVSLSVADSTGDTSAIERFAMNVSSPALVPTTVNPCSFDHFGK